ncbi:MAG: polymer-forming cytoskeletal protein [Bacteroidales bacterium]|jgi:cytoskeletal protein CcmA (bactofilin family)|nr:polymer-forming cytoskeletal protein [Bacteroidales bacterium]
MAKETETLSSYNIISAGTIIKGELHTPGNIRIDGAFEGEITSKGRLIVGQAGSVSGRIACQNAELEGQIDANITVEQHLALKSTAKLIGDVKTDKISIETGAVFHGHCQMNIHKAEIPFDKD